MRISIKKSNEIYTNNELSEIGMKKTVPFTSVSKKFKYLGI